MDDDRAVPKHSRSHSVLKTQEYVQKQKTVFWNNWGQFLDNPWMILKQSFILDLFLMIHMWSFKNPDNGMILILGRFLDDSWMVLGWFLDDSWKIHGWLLHDSWRFTLLEYSWMTLGKFWMILEKFLDDSWMVLWWFLDGSLIVFIWSLVNSIICCSLDCSWRIIRYPLGGCLMIVSWSLINPWIIFERFQTIFKEASHFPKYGFWTKSSSFAEYVCTNDRGTSALSKAAR